MFLTATHYWRRKITTKKKYFVGWAKEERRAHQWQGAGLMGTLSLCPSYVD